MTRSRVFSILTSAFVVLIGLSIADSAFAAKKKLSSSACDFGSALYDSTSQTGTGLNSSIGCMLYGGTNDNAKNDIPDLDPFGIDDWVLADKSDGGGNGIIDLTISFSDNKDYLGTWSVDSFAGFSDVFITIKSGNGFAAYLIDTTKTAGEWTTAALFPTKHGGKELSHMSIFYSESSITAVPLPAALPLYAAGVVILGFMGYRKRKS